MADIPDNLPPIVGKRNHFESVQEVVDDATFSICRMFPDWDEKATDRFRAWLSEYSVRLLHEIMWALKTGADRGIEQAAALLRDPDYYQNRKRRDKLQRERRSEKRREEERQRLEKEIAGPTEAELRRKRAMLERQLAYYRERIQETEEELRMMPELKNIVRVKGPIQ